LPAVLTVQAAVGEAVLSWDCLRQGASAGGDVEGTGLGLSVVYNLVRIHEASISVESRRGEGTTFTLEIPLYRNNPSTRSLAHCKTVLISDDMMQKNQLEQVVNAEDLVCIQDINEALEKVSYTTYATAMVDADFLDDDTSIDLLAKIRCQNPEIMIVLVSSILNKQKTESIKLSDKQLLKPCSPEILHGLLLGKTRPVLT
jgi:hypothetical protein